MSMKIVKVVAFGKGRYHAFIPKQEKGPRGIGSTIHAALGDFEREAGALPPPSEFEPMPLMPFLRKGVDMPSSSCLIRLKRNPRVWGGGRKEIDARGDVLHNHGPLFGYVVVIE